MLDELKEDYSWRSNSRNTAIPRAYIEMILSSKPSKRVCPFGTICGSKVELRSRGTSRGNSPKSPLRVLRDLQLRELPEFVPACYKRQAERDAREGCLITLAAWLLIAFVFVGTLAVLHLDPLATSNPVPATQEAPYAK